MGMNSNVLLEMSLRSKFAFGLCCVENAIKKYSIGDVELQHVIDKAWEFTSLPVLDEWEDQIKEIMPWGILDPYPRALEEKKSISVEQGVKLKEIYAKLPQSLITMLDDVIFIGINNLYVDVIKNSLETSKILARIIKSCQRDGIPLPDPVLFLKSKIDEDYGWGKERPRSFFIE